MAALDTSLCHSHFGVVARLLFLIYLVCHSTVAAGSVNGGFSVKLIHQDSPNSPFYDHNKALSKTSFSDFHPGIQLPHNHNGQYLMRVTIGNPPFDIYGMLDTGSDLLWTQCEPCQGFYKQMNPKFNPKRSSIYSNLPCSAQKCQAIGTGLCSPHNSCTYNYAYGSASLTQGVLAK